ncbi:MAG: hypothetical protein EON87_07770 [Brevundimonas sp.]|nr:MAG: hypothetical protein EON87_07770 [Brevundimonas sp.]
MIHLKIAEVGGKPVIELDEASLAALGAGVGDLVAVEAVADTPVERGKAFVERYIKTFEALAK